MNNLKIKIVSLLVTVLFISCDDDDDDSDGGGSNPDKSIVSTFESSDEEWRIIGDAESVNPKYISAGGNPNGFISADDNTTGGVWYFKAPEKFLGDKEYAYGSKITFDLRQSSTSSQFDNVDLKLIGENKTIVFDTAYNPEKTWTNYTVKLDSSAGWKLDNLEGDNASESDIKDVLSLLTGFYIRGEYVIGSDTGSLDNVKFALVEN